MGLADYRSETRYGRIFLIGVGTVFGTLGVIILAMIIATLNTVGLIGGISQGLKWVALYGFVGALIAAFICAVTALPMMLLWVPIFKYLIRKGYRETPAAMMTAGLLAFVASVAVIGWWGGWVIYDTVHADGQVARVVAAGAMVSVAVGLAVALAWASFRRREET
jgi:hypothetical protein